MEIETLKELPIEIEYSALEGQYNQLKSLSNICLDIHKKAVVI